MAQITRADSVLITQNLTTTSQLVADKFGKRHADVLRIIESIGTPKEFTQRNFALSEYQDSTGRLLPAYELTRDGFALLVMGFTGKAAMTWKIRFLEAFNAMEAELSIPQAALQRNQARLALPPLPPRKVAPCDRTAALEHLIRRLRDHHPTVTYAIALDREEIADELDRLAPVETPQGKTNVRAHLRKLSRKGAT